MTVSTTVTYLEYVAGINQAIFNFSGLSYLSGESNTVLKIYIDDVIASNYTIVEGAAVDGVATGGDLTFDTALTGGQTVKIQRETELTQPTIYPDNYTKETSRESSDRQLMQIQEVEANATGGGSSTVQVQSTLPDWDTATDYIVDQQVLYRGVAPNQQFVYRALVAHTSGDFNTDLVAGNWELVYLLGVTGDTGEKGDDGDQGPQGVQGTQGIAGNDGIIVAIADQPTAEAGLNNTEGVTPLRTAQAIEFQVPNLPVIVDHEARITSLEVLAVEHNDAILNLTGRVEVIENANPYDAYTGSQPLDNNVAAVDLEGANLGPDGKGVPLLVQSSGSQLTRFILQVNREDDTEKRFEQKNIALHFIDNVWYLGVEQEIVLAGALAGVELAITTTDLGGGIYQGQVSYTSDDMTGLSYSGRIKWISVDEISVGV